MSGDAKAKPTPNHKIRLTPRAIRILRWIDMKSDMGKLLTACGSDWQTVESVKGKLSIGMYYILPGLMEDAVREDWVNITRDE